MDIKITKFAFWRNVRLIVFLPFVLFSCDEDDTLYLSKEFNFPVTISPAKENFEIGDTLKIEILIPEIMADRENSVQYLFENFDFDPYLSIRELSEKSKDLAEQPGAVRKVKIINVEGDINPFSAAGCKLTLINKDSAYRLTSKFVVLDSGIYNLSFSTTSISGTAKLINPPKGYKKIIAGVGPSYFLVNSGIEINSHLINQHTASNFDFTSSEGWARPFFSFRVVK
ncbi:MAG: hypothetical protein ACJLTB_17760 [Algoriphagus aquaeductus]|uniref:hypothetical protein n=1 Tax=Algoriphagus aquaeductus TaxID=475299 RepID=UPI00387A69FF